jgi:hypothetical protein
VNLSEILSLILFNILIYWRTLSYGLVIDDIDWYTQWDDQWRRTDRGLGYSGNRWWWLHPHTILHSLYGAATLYAFNRHLRSYRLDHIITLTLHIITALLIAHVSIIAAFLWSIHPCNHQTAIWLTGRRYSLLNILFLTLLLTHTLYLLIPAVLFIAHHYYHAISSRIKKKVPTGEFSAVSILNTVRYTIWRLSGIPRYSFRYPYHNVAPYLPCTQPIAERYLAIPLILTCLLLSHIPFIYVIIPLYAFRTIQLIPMYRNIQAFYDYHRYLYPDLEKLVLIARLYPSIQT